jgi:hypothetical protein
LAPVELAVHLHQLLAPLEATQLLASQAQQAVVVVDLVAFLQLLRHLLPVVLEAAALEAQVVPGVLALLETLQAQSHRKVITAAPVP